MSTARISYLALGRGEAMLEKAICKSPTSISFSVFSPLWVFSAAKFSVQRKFTHFLTRFLHACDVGVMENRLDAHAAPSGALDVTGGTFWAMMLFNGSARPRIPLKSGASGSSSTSDAAAAGN